MPIFLQFINCHNSAFHNFPAIAKKKANFQNASINTTNFSILLKKIFLISVPDFEHINKGTGLGLEERTTLGN